MREFISRASEFIRRSSHRETSRPFDEDRKIPVRLPSDTVTYFLTELALLPIYPLKDALLNSLGADLEESNQRIASLIDTLKTSRQGSSEGQPVSMQVSAKDVDLLGNVLLFMISTRKEYPISPEEIEPDSPFSDLSSYTRRMVAIRTLHTAFKQAGGPERPQSG